MLRAAFSLNRLIRINGRVTTFANIVSAVITATSVDGAKTAKCKITVLESVVMYRLYNPNSGEHFYTGSQSEIKTIVAAGWKNEGIAWYGMK